MLFHEYSFLFVFLPLMLLVYHLAPRSARNAVLTFGSLTFYSVTSLFYLPVLLASTVLDHFVGGRIASSDRPGERRALLVLSVSVNLALLGCFKYAGFFTQVLSEDLAVAGVPVLDVTLPVGISFYTFQSMSYSIDVYRGHARRARSLVDFAAFVSCFPQLIAGPIVRYRELDEQLRERRETAAQAFDGVALFVIGLAKKLLLADTAAAIADPLFAAGVPGTAAAWVGVLGYGAQIYFDFSGYSDMARGLGKLFGFELPVNFNSPYKSASFREFWRRWHITLSSWLRDNVFVPLGGSRRGRRRTVVALSTTMLLGGLWHGASWNFVIWGGLHGLYLSSERLAAQLTTRRPPRVLSRAVVFVAVSFAWVFFRVEGLGSALAWSRAMLSPTDGEAPPALESLVVVCLLGIAFLAPNSDAIDRRPRPTLVAGLVVLAAISLFTGFGRGLSPFLYFRF